MDDLHIVTVATESKYYFPYLVESCRRHGKELEILGFGQKWKGFNWRFKLMIEYLKTLKSDDIVCVVDGYDVICTRNLCELKKMFLKVKNETKCKIIVGFDNIKHTNYINKFTIKMYYGTCDDISLNAGTYIGYAKDLLEITKRILNKNSKDNADDQKLLTNLCNSDSKLFNIDTNNNFFLTLVHPLHEIDDVIEINEYGEISYDGVFPFFLHGPGSTYFDNVIKKLGYNNIANVNQLIKNKNSLIFILVNAYTNFLTMIFIFIILLLLIFLYYYTIRS